MSEPAQLSSEPVGAAWVPGKGDVVGGRYRIGGMVGRGGMGAVYNAIDLQGQHSVAVKWVLPDKDRGRSRGRLLREAALASRIQHPNVVRMHEVGEDRGSIFLVMELLQGESLESWVLRGPFVASMAIPLMFPVLRGIGAAHAAGVVHRDIKPHNVILCHEPDGFRPTVIDFGISRGEGIEGDLTLTQTGIMVGTPLYMAPEQLAGAEDTDHRLDIYALGVILYELLSGGSPFEAEKYGPLLTEKLTRAAIPLKSYVPDVDPALERVVMRALERNPNKRFSTVAELARALEPWAQGITFDSAPPLYRGPIPEASESATLRVRRTVRRRAPRRWPWVVAAALVVLGGVGLGLWLAGDDPDLAVTELPRERPASPPPPEPVPEAEPEPEPEPEPEVAQTEPEPGVTEAPEEPVAEQPAAVGRRSRRSRGRRRSQGRSGRLRADDFF